MQIKNFELVEFAQKKQMKESTKGVYKSTKAKDGKETNGSHGTEKMQRRNDFDEKTGMEKREKIKIKTKKEKVKGEKFHSSNVYRKISREALRKLFELLNEVNRSNQNLHWKKQNENWRNTNGKNSQFPIGLRPKSRRRCYNCGSFQHEGLQCTYLELGTRCFNCGLFGHLSAICSRRQEWFDPMVISNGNQRKDQAIQTEDIATEELKTPKIDLQQKFSIISRPIQTIARMKPSTSQECFNWVRNSCGTILSLPLCDKIPASSFRFDYV